MDTTLSRRGLLAGMGGFGLMAAAPKSWAAAAADWRIGITNAPAEGYAPSELTRLHGRMPQGLSGSFYRNGPAWFRYGDATVDHWFDGDGMVQHYELSASAIRHSGRFVDTVKRRVEQAAGRPMMPGFGTKADPAAVLNGPDDANAANTSVLRVGDELWALWEAGSPWRLDPQTLAGRGPVTFRDDLKGMAFLAHPKVEPSGRIWSAGFAGDKAWIWQLDAAGRLERGEMIDLPLPGYTHDWAVTENHLIFPMQPWELPDGPVAPMANYMVWRPQDGLKILVVDKADFSKRRVYELPAAFYFHTGDAWEDSDGTLHFDVCLSATPAFAAETARQLVHGQYAPTPGEKSELALVSLSPDGRATMRPTGISAEFPQTDHRRQGLRRNLVAHVHGLVPGRPGATALSVFDWSTGKSQTHDFGTSAIVEEALFVPRGSDEFDGWLVGTVLDLKAKATEVHIFDARHVSDGPVASWQNQHATPLGFHGTFKAG